MAGFFLTFDFTAKTPGWPSSPLGQQPGQCRGQVEEGPSRVGWGGLVHGLDQETQLAAICGNMLLWSLLGWEEDELTAD